MEGRFTGKVALVTGAASGIGRRIAERLAAEGAAVVLADRSGPAAEQAAAALAAEGRSARAVEGDVTHAADCQRMVEDATTHFGGLDVLVNSAGIGRGGPIAELPESDWDVVLDVNLKGTFLVCRAAFPALVARGGGAIINLASLAGMAASPGFGAYAASKAGVIQLTRVLAVEGAPQGIRANSLCPVWIDTPLLEGYITRTPDPAATRRQMTAMIPLGRIGSVDDVAAAALFLASDEASFITGVALPLDGGAFCR